jgi:hypothetical protein
MSVTVRDTANSTPTGQAGRSFPIQITTGVWYSQPSGSKLLIWDLTDPDNVVLATTFDLTTPTSFDPMTYTAVGQAVGCKVNLGYNFDLNSNGHWLVVNYDPAGNCYVCSYRITLDGNGVPTSIVQEANELLGTNAPNTLINQGCEIFGPGLYSLFPFGDDIVALKGISTGGFLSVDTVTTTIATTPGNQAHGVCVNDYATETIFYATGRLDGILTAYMVDSPAFSQLWQASTAAPEARNCYRSLSTDSVQVVAVVTIDGAQNFVELFDPDDGATLGTYENLLGGEIQDVFLRDTCMFVFTDGAADNIQTVDISDPGNPVFSASSTVANYEFLASKTSTLAPDETAFVVSGNLTSTGEAGIAVISLGATCDSAPPAATGKIDCYIVGDYLYSIDDTPQLEITDISDPTSPLSVGTLALDEAPTSIWVNEHNAIISYYGGFWIVNIDDPTAPTLETTKEVDDNFDFVVAPGGILFLSGEMSRLSIYDPGQDPPGNMENFAIANGGVSSVALLGSRVFFADIAPTGNSKLYSYSTGGFSCHSVAAGIMSTDELKAEEIHARHGKFKGDLVAHSLMLTEDLEATGIVLIDTVTGNKYRVTVDSGVLTATLL